MGLREVPEHTALCYSPGYSQASRPAFEAFALTLAKRFGARIVRLPPPAAYAAATACSRMGLPQPVYRTLRQGYFEGVRWLRHQGIY